MQRALQEALASLQRHRVVRSLVSSRLNVRVYNRVVRSKSSINSTNQNRVYYLDIPANYDPTTPYRLFYISHWIGSRYQDVVSNNFYGLKTIAEANGEPAIFIAPSSDGSTWQEKDHALFDDLLAFDKEFTLIPIAVSEPEQVEPEILEDRVVQLGLVRMLREPIVVPSNGSTETLERLVALGKVHVDVGVERRHGASAWITR